MRTDGVGVQVYKKEKIFERGSGKNTGPGLLLLREILAIFGIVIKRQENASYPAVNEK